MCFITIKKCADRLDKYKYISVIKSPSHNGRQQNRFRYPNVPAGIECHTGIGDIQFYRQISTTIILLCRAYLCQLQNVT